MHNLLQEFYGLLEEFFISKAFFMMEYKKRNPSFSPDSYINQALVRNVMKMSRYSLVEQFYKLMEEFFIFKAFFMMEYDEKILLSLRIVILISR